MSRIEIGQNKILWIVLISCLSVLAGCAGQKPPTTSPQEVKASVLDNRLEEFRQLSKEEQAVHINKMERKLCEDIHKLDDEYGASVSTSGLLDARRKCYLREHSNIDPKIREVIENGSNVFQGMNAEDALALIGIPQKINRTVIMTGLGRRSEQWVYSFLILYFEDGKLTAWQD